MSPEVLAEQARYDRRRDRRGVVVMLLVLLLMGYIGYDLYATRASADGEQARAEQAEQTVTALQADVSDLAAQVRGLGGVPVADVADPPAAPGLDVDAVLALVDDRIDRLRESLPGPPSVDVVAATALAELEQRGLPAPDPAVLRAVLADVCSTGDQCRGTDGADGVDGVDGEPGRAPTDAEVDAAVARFCGSGQCRGPQGVGLDPATAPRFEGDSTSCVVVWTLLDPATDERTEQRAQVPTEFCASPAPTDPPVPDPVPEPDDGLPLLPGG